MEYLTVKLFNGDDEESETSSEQTTETLNKYAQEGWILHSTQFLPTPLATDSGYGDLLLIFHRQKQVEIFSDHPIDSVILLESREDWLKKLKPIKKGEKLSNLNTVKVMNSSGFYCYGVISGISAKRLYYIQYREYVSMSGETRINRSSGNSVDRVKGSTKTLHLESIESPEDLFKISRMVSICLSQEKKS